MREIKFRAWDKENKKMVYKNPWLWIDYAGLVSELKENKYVARFGIFDIMQYTGLDDKKGKEIYEGDIVEYKMPSPLYQNETFITEKSTVIFSDINCRFQTDKGANLTPGHIVIGNIYENPELLTNKD